MVDWVGELLCRPVQELPGVHSMRPSFPHHLQHGGGRTDPTLGKGGGRQRDGAGGFWDSSSDARCALLHGRLTVFIHLTIPDS